MITAHPTGQQTGAYSRIVNPRMIITTEEIRARIHAGTNPRSPIRNLLAGAEEACVPCSPFERIRRWLRGDR